MEDRDLQDIWKKIDSGLEYKSKDDLNQLLNSKAKKTINNYSYHFIFSALTSLGFIVFLIITMINRWDDLFYRINNMILGFYTILALISSIWSIYNLKNNRTNLPLKEWLKFKIEILSKWIFNKTVYYILPVIFVLTILSIHVYYEHKPFIEVIKSEDSIYGLPFGFVIGLIVSFVVVIKIRQKQRNNLEFLKSLYKQICNSIDNQDNLT
jgi:hypothetical protein